MNLRQRDFSILGYLMAITKKAEDTTIDDVLKYRASVLRKACITTTGEYPGGKITKKEIKKINEKVEYLIDKTFHIGAMSTEKEITKAITSISMMLCFMDEIYKNAKNKWYLDSFANITKKIVWLSEYLDPKYSHYEFYKNGERLYQEMCEKF